MLSCHVADLPPFTVNGIVQAIRATFRGLPNTRKGGNNQQFTMKDAGLSAFSVFFTQNPSFLDYQVRMQKERGRNNAASLFGVHKIPCDQQIRNLLDPVAPDAVAPLWFNLVEALDRGGALADYRRFAGDVLIALDGTQYFASEKISCPHCTMRTLANGTVQYSHTVVTPVVLAPARRRSSRCRRRSSCLRTATQRLTDTYRYLNDWPLRNSDDALLVGWCELTTTDAAGRVIDRHAWATSRVVRLHARRPGSRTA